MENAGAWKMIQILYYILLGSVIIFLGFASFYVNRMGVLIKVDSGLNDILGTAAIILGLTAYLGAKLYDKMQLKKLPNITDNMEKINWFRTSLIVQIGIMEFASQTVILLYLLTGSYLTLTPLIITLGVMVFIRPEIYKASELLNIPKEKLLKM